MKPETAILLHYYATAKRVSAHSYQTFEENNFSKQKWLPRLRGVNFRPMDCEYYNTKEEALNGARRLREYFKQQIADTKENNDD